MAVRKHQPLLPPPTYSARCYIKVNTSQTRLFRYLLEGYDNLAYTSVVDRRSCILKIVYSPQQQLLLSEALNEMQHTLPFEILPLASIS